MKKNLTKGLFNWTVLALIGLAIVLVNVIGSFLYYKIDMTKDQRYSLAKSTEAFLENKDNFENRISIQIYLEGNMPSEIKHFQTALKDKLQDFKRVAGNRIEYLFTDINVGSEEEINAMRAQLYDKGKGIMPLEILYMKDGTQSKVMLFPGAIMSYTVNGVTKENMVQFLPGTQPGHPYSLEEMNEIIETSLNNLEYNLIASMRRLTQVSKPTIAFLQGHGELTYQQTMRARALLAPYFSLKDVNLRDSIAALNDVDGVIIANPSLPYSDTSLYILDQFVMRGGKLMVFMNTLWHSEDSLMSKGMTHTTRKYLKLDKLLYDYGINVRENYMMDVQCAPKIVPFAESTFIPWFFHVLATPSKHPITRNVDPILLKYANELSFVDLPNIKQTTLLTSSTNSVPSGLQPFVNLGLPLNYGKSPKLIDNPEDPVNKLCLGAMVEGYFQSRYNNRLAPEMDKMKHTKYAFLPKSKKEGKVLVIGNGTFFANTYDSMPNPKGLNYLYRPNSFNELKMDPDLYQRRISIYYGNQEFFQNIVDYMMGDNSVLDIRSRQIDIKEIDKEKVTKFSGFYKTINMLLPLGIIILLSVLMNFIRTRRYARK
jgi:gliding-associated putative ABC transporter substrate-binding component GldG